MKTIMRLIRLIRLMLEGRKECYKYWEEKEAKQS